MVEKFQKGVRPGRKSEMATSRRLAGEEANRRQTNESHESRVMNKAFEGSSMPGKFVQRKSCWLRGVTWPHAKEPFGRLQIQNVQVI